MIQEDALCLSMLSSLLYNGTFCSFSIHSLRPSSIVCIINDINLNQRRSILEFGSGISTILMARLITRNSIPAKITSIESDEAWLSNVQRMLVADGVSESVQMIYAPMVKGTKFGLLCHWYDQACLNDYIPHRAPFDLVLIDGPKACDESIEMSRYDAMPFVNDLLAPNYSIFLDDANRPGEKKVMRHWKDEFGVVFDNVTSTLAVSTKGPVFRVKPV